MGRTSLPARICWIIVVNGFHVPMHQTTFVSCEFYEVMPEMLFLEMMVAAIERSNGLGVLPKAYEVPSYRSVIGIVTVTQRAYISITLSADM
jgi:hypothetical protein